MKKKANRTPKAYPCPWGLSTPFPRKWKHNALQLQVNAGNNRIAPMHYSFPNPCLILGRVDRDMGTYTSWGSVSLQILCICAYLCTIHLHAFVVPLCEYNLRQSLLDINNICTNSVSDFIFTFHRILPVHIRNARRKPIRKPQHSEPFIPTESDHKQRWGKCRGLWAKLRLNPYLPPHFNIFLANVWSLENKLGEFRIGTLTQREFDYGMQDHDFLRNFQNTNFRANKEAACSGKNSWVM